METHKKQLTAAGSRLEDCFRRLSALVHGLQKPVFATKWDLQGGALSSTGNPLLLDTLITSKTRVKLLLKFFSNSRTTAYLRGLSEEFGESTNAVRMELNRLSEADLITSQTNGRKRVYRANADHPLFPELESLTRKYLGLDRIEQVMKRLGDVKLALITGDYARGSDTGIIDLVIVGRVDDAYLRSLVEKAESVIGRKIRMLLISPEEYPQFEARFADEKALVLWEEG